MAIRLEAMTTSSSRSYERNKETLESQVPVFADEKALVAVCSLRAAGRLNRATGGATLAAVAPAGGGGGGGHGVKWPVTQKLGNLERPVSQDS